MMGIRSILIKSILPLLLVAAQSNASKCNCEGYFCVSDTEYQLCQNGEVSGDPIPCDEGVTCRNNTEIDCSRQPLCQQNSFDEDNSPVEARRICQGRSSYPDPESCEQFYLCVGYGVGKLMSCPTGTYYNEITLTCGADMPERCRLGGIEEEMVTDGVSTTQTSQTDQDVTTIYPTDDPQSTTEKPAEEITTNNSEMPDQTTDGVKEITTTQTEVTERTTTTTVSPPKYENGFVCPGEGYYPDPEDCQRYYVCDVVDRPMRVSCSEGTYYVEEFQFCSKEIPERCLGSSTPSVTTSKTDEDQTTERVSTRNPDSNNDQVEGMTSTTTQAPSDFICPDEGFFPDPENCHRYYSCIDLEHAFPVVCPDDTYFDEVNILCTVEMPERCRKAERPSDDVPTTTEQATTRTTETITSTTKGIPTTEETPEGDFECPGEGYFADPNNCQKYFFCFNSGSSFIGMPIVCPENTYYDEESEFCTSDIPERCFGQSGSSTTTSPKNDDEFSCPGDGYYPDPKNCTLYYMCYTDFAIPLACPSGTYFDNESDFCTEQIPERCQASDDDAQRTTTPSYTEKPTTGKNGFECPGEGYYPDPENCQHYYICYSWGSAIPVSCPDNTYFDLESSFCTNEVPDRCRMTGRPPGNEETPTTPSVPTRDEFTCPGEGFYPDPKDCQSYYICYGGNRFIQLSCPENTFYDAESTFCRTDMPERCRMTEKPTQDNTDGTTTPRNDLDITSTTPVPQQEVFKCPGEGYFSDPEDCHRYYVCFGFGSPIRLTCPDNTYFDGKGFCTLERPEKCTPQFPTKPPKQQDTEEGFKCPASGQFPDPKDCQKYWICYSNNFGYPVQCPNGTYYDEGSTYCTSTKPARCVGPEDREFKCPGEGYFANPTDCHSYYVCYSPDLSISMQCPGNSYYHQSMEGCAPDVPMTCKNPDGGEKFVCPRAGYFPDPRDCKRYYVCNFWGDALLMKCPRDKYFNENLRGCSSRIPPRCQSLTPPLQNGFICPNSGYFADPVDCSMYHVCNVFGRHYTATCPPKMYYHEDTRTCTPMVPDRCIYLRTKITAPNSVENPEEMPVLSDTGNPLNISFVCPDKGLFPDPYDCHKFYVCYGQPRQVTCWGKTYYSEETQKCEEDMPERCKIHESDRTTLPPSMSSSTPLPEEFVCPGRGLFPDPDDCHKFYVCYGQPRQVTCRDRMYFDEESQQCSEKMPERCNNNGNGNVTPLPTTPPSATDEFVCPDQGLFAHPTNCHKFFVCFGETREVTCWGSTYYDEETQKCVENMPDRCRTDGDDNVTPPTTQQPGTFVCLDQGLFPDPEDCRKFYVCYGAIRHVTCREGMYFDEETKQCDTNLPERCRPREDETSTTVPKTTTEKPTTPQETFECRNPGRYPDPLDCRRFYFCNYRQEAFHYTCKDSTYFNDVTNKCQPHIPDRCRTDDDRDTTTTPKSPQAFVCRKAGRYPDPEDCLSYYYCSYEDSIPIRSSCPTNQFFDANKGKCKKIKTGYECPTGNSDHVQTDSDEDDDDEDFVCTQPGLFPDVRDCKKFYECTFSLKMNHKTCSGRTYFNEKFRYCSIFTTERCKMYGIFW